MSSPIILKRDLSTFTYLANKRNLPGLSLHMLQKSWKLHQQSYARRATILKLITGWNVDGSRYALYTRDPQAKLINACCPFCLAPDSDLHWICDCPCPALKEPRDTLIQETVPAHLHQLLTHTEQHQEHLLPQLSDLCRALRTGLTNSPHRELLWKGAWTTNLIASFADTARANTRINPWRSPQAIALLTKTLKNFGVITTAFVLQAWKLRRRAAFQIHQKICNWPTPSFFDHVPRLPHIDSIKFMEPTLTEDQIQITLNKLLRLNPARPDLAYRTFGRRRRRIQQQLQPPPEPTTEPTMPIPDHRH
jgi:hypothetical protein